MVIVASPEPPCLLGTERSVKRRSHLILALAQGGMYLEAPS